MRRIFQFLFLSLVLLACAAGAAAWWLSQPLTLRNPTVELEIEPGTAPRAVAQTAVAAGVQTDARLLYAWFRLSGKDRQIRAGNYEILPGTTPYSLLQKLVQGDESLVAITFVEGWTFRQMRAAIAKEATLKPDTAALTEAQIMAALGKPGVPAEGRFFPDTYTYAKGSSSLAVLRRAAAAMDKRLAQHAFLAGDEYTIADMAIYPWIVSHQWQSQNLDDFPALKAWFERIKARPATQRAYALVEKINPPQP